jgi:tetraacyldisaccharide 4'-kinase
MSLATPRFWYGSRTSWQAGLLRPCGWLYGLAVAGHRAVSRPLRLPVPVLSIGNITLGGTGKTPLVIALALEFSRRGLRLAVLSRGYGSGRRSPLLVGADLPVARVGDEALELARALAGSGVAVWTGSDRAASARRALAAGAELLLLDDGLQHWRLARDCDVTVLDASQRLGNGLTFPAGPLREPARALGRAQLLVLTGTGDGQPRGLPWPEGKPWLAVPSTLEVPAALRGRPLLAFCGIGLPEKFFASLRRQGCWLVGCETFPDHHPYAQDDLERLLALARAQQEATLVTTVKDWQRLAPLLERRALAPPMPAAGDLERVVPIPLRLDGAAVARLADQLLALLAPADG